MVSVRVDFRRVSIRAAGNFCADWCHYCSRFYDIVSLLSESAKLEYFLKRQHSKNVIEIENLSAACLKIDAHLDFPEIALNAFFAGFPARRALPPERIHAAVLADQGSKSTWIAPVDRWVAQSVTSVFVNERKTR